MPTNTTSATPRFLLRVNDDPHGAGSSLARGYQAYPGRTGNLSSPAGSTAAGGGGAHRRTWLARLRRALREEKFVLHYQPIVSVCSGQISHYEALVRLADQSDGTLLAPAGFLPAAERYGLIQEIDRLVLARVIALMGQARESAPVSPRAPAGGSLTACGADSHTDLAPLHPVVAPTGQDICIAVNLSALSLIDSGMFAYIGGLLSRHRVDPRRLIVEITETAAISDMDRARIFCEDIQALGCSVALDDFGAGFGSFQYLKHLPFRYLKIDGEFIRDLPSSRKDQLVVQALVGVARGMGKHTIAEFVGDQATMNKLRDYGVDYAQGFEIGRPAPAIPALARAA